MDYQAGSFPLGRIFGIPIRLHWLFLLFLVLQVLASIRPNSLWPLYWFLILGPILLVTVLLHELGHCLAARSVGGTAHSILLWPLGGLAYIGSHNKGPKADVWVAVAGPLTHVPMTAFWVLMLLVATYVAYGTTHITLVWPAYLTIHNLGVAVCVGAVVLNISLFAFNLLVPAYPLDGGRILVGSLLSCGVAVRTTALITCGLAVPLAIGIIVFGGITFSVIIILVGVWILYTTWELIDSYRKDQLAQHPLFSHSSLEQAAATIPHGAPDLAGSAHVWNPGSVYQPPVQGYPGYQYPMHPYNDPRHRSSAI